VLMMRSRQLTRLRVTSERLCEVEERSGGSQDSSLSLSSSSSLSLLPVSLKTKHFRSRGRATSRHRHNTHTYPHTQHNQHSNPSSSCSSGCSSRAGARPRAPAAARPPRPRAAPCCIGGGRSCARRPGRASSKVRSPSRHWDGPRARRGDLSRETRESWRRVLLARPLSRLSLSSGSKDDDGGAQCRGARRVSCRRHGALDVRGRDSRRRGRSVARASTAAAAATGTDDERPERPVAALARSRVRFSRSLSLSAPPASALSLLQH
jgi:hypothetical protein